MSTPPQLPLAAGHAGRSARTCELKCASACAHPAPNASDNDYLGDIVTAAISRRSLLRGGVSALVVGALLPAGGLLRPRPAGAAPGGTATADRGGTGAPIGAVADSGTGLTFAPIAATDATVDAVIVPHGYTHNVVIRWGDPVLAGAPPIDYANQTGASQQGQFGYNCDYVGFFSLGVEHGATPRGLLAVNHEYTIPELMFPGYVPGAPTLDQVEAELAAHGMSIIEVRRDHGGRGGFILVPGSGFNRRTTATTPTLLTGPAAGHELLQTSADPFGAQVLGTLNNCAGGNTPWGTVLTAEENFNQYFANAGALPDGPVKTAHARYGLPTGPSSRRWENFFDRFDLAQEPNEPFRHGWIVEIDPFDPTFVPRKHTALGRFKHEAATVHIAPDGRVVAYSGDDERFDYVYKFVSRLTYREGDKAHNLTLLEDGDLYVAKFNGNSPPAELQRYNDTAAPGQLPDDGEFDGTGTWIPLVLNGRSQVHGFTVAEVLITTRLAADAVSPTKMDRPEDIERNPVNGRVYMAMTNNTRRGVGTNPDIDEANPRRVDATGATTGNKYGHIVELMEDGNDGTATTFSWRLFLVCGDPADPTTYFAGFPREGVSPIAAPDNVNFDALGNLWIATDGQPGTLGKADAFHAVPVEGSQRGSVRQFLSVPAGAEACGPEFTPDQRTLFCAVQHPGDDVPSNWPDGGGAPPRPAVVSVHKRRGDRRIGS